MRQCAVAHAIICANFMMWVRCMFHCETDRGTDPRRLRCCCLIRSLQDWSGATACGTAPQVQIKRHSCEPLAIIQQWFLRSNRCKCSTCAQRELLCWFRKHAAMPMHCWPEAARPGQTAMPCCDALPESMITMKTVGCTHWVPARQDLQNRGMQRARCRDCIGRQQRIIDIFLL